MLKKIIHYLAIAAFLFNLINPSIALADIQTCASDRIDFNPKVLQENQSNVAMTFTGPFTDGVWYKMAVQTPSKVDVDVGPAQASGGAVTLTLYKGQVLNNNMLDKGPHDAKLQSTATVDSSGHPTGFQDLCTGIHYEVGSSGASCNLVLAGDQGPGQTTFTTNQSFILRAEGAPAGTYKVCFNQDVDDRGRELSNSYTVDNSGIGQQMTISPFTTTTYSKALLSLVPSKIGSECTIARGSKGTSSDTHLCWQSIDLVAPGNGSPPPAPSPLPSVLPSLPDTVPGFNGPQADAGGAKCDSTSASVNTAIGCIHTSPAQFVADILRFVVGIAGGIAFLMMLLGAFQMITSSGNPDHLHNGRERLTSAVIGLMFIIFAVLFLQILGVDILKLPGFGKS